MTGWAWMILPAMATALLVRGQALITKPYFALSDLFASGPHVQEYTPLPHPTALLSRFVWPLVLGFVLSWAPMTLWEIALCGLLSGVLVLWPLAFHGFPWGVTRRKWHLIVLYLGFLAAYAAVSALGATVQTLLMYLSSGDIKKWAADQLASALIAFILSLILVPSLQHFGGLVKQQRTAIDFYKHRLAAHIQNRHIKKQVKRIQKHLAQASVGDWEPIVISIFLVESLERPQLVRAGEWIAQVANLRSDMTCGPLQSRNSPFRLKTAVLEAVNRLENAGVIPSSTWDVELVARTWHGAASQQPGESISYSQALSLASAAQDSHW